MSASRKRSADSELYSDTNKKRPSAASSAAASSTSYHEEEQKEEQDDYGLTDMPNEILQQMFSYLEPKDLRSMLRVNKQMHSNVDRVSYQAESLINKTGNTYRALGYAVYHKRPDIVRYLVLHKGAKNSDALYIAATRGYYPIISLLLEHGNYTPIQVNRALRFAAEYGHITIVKYIIEHFGAVIHKTNAGLYYAARQRHWDTVKYLLQHGIEFVPQSEYAYKDEMLRRSVMNKFPQYFHTSSYINYEL